MITLFKIYSKNKKIITRSLSLRNRRNIYNSVLIKKMSNVMINVIKLKLNLNIYFSVLNITTPNILNKVWII